MTDCKCKDSTGWTTVKCCNLCGKSVEEFWKVDDAKDKEIQSLTEDNLQLRNAAEIAANMYGNLLNQKSEVHKQVESLTEQLQKANEIIDQLNTGHP